MPHDMIMSLIQDLTARVTKLEAQLAAKEAKKGQLAEDPLFEKFWQLYPRKVGRVDARRAWNQLTAADRQMALLRAALYREVWDLAPEDRKQFVKYPASWIRARAWEDGEAEWKCVAWNGKGQQIQRALVGSHPDTTPTRTPDESSPAWTRAVQSALISPSRPAVSDELVAHYIEWCHFTDVGEPDGWAEEIDRAFTEAKELAR